MTPETTDEPPWVVIPRLQESGPFQGSDGQPRETTQHLLGPIWATFGLLNSDFTLYLHNSLFLGEPSKLHQISFIEMRTILIVL